MPYDRELKKEIPILEIILLNWRHPPRSSNWEAVSMDICNDLSIHGKPRYYNCLRVQKDLPNLVMAFKSFLKTYRQKTDTTSKITCPSEADVNTEYLLGCLWCLTDVRGTLQ